LRLLVVVCPEGHTLLEVFPTAEGPHALWCRRERWRLDGTGEVVELMPARRTWMAMPVLSRADFDGDLLGSTCRCKETTTVRLGWIRAQLDAGTRRVVAPN
jgi:hypothetical protein